MGSILIISGQAKAGAIWGSAQKRHGGEVAPRCVTRHVKKEDAPCANQRTVVENPVGSDLLDEQEPEEGQGWPEERHLGRARSKVVCCSERVAVASKGQTGRAELGRRGREGAGQERRSRSREGSAGSLGGRWSRGREGRGQSTGQGLIEGRRERKTRRARERTRDQTRPGERGQTAREEEQSGQGRGACCLSGVPTSSFEAGEADRSESTFWAESSSCLSKREAIERYVSKRSLCSDDGDASLLHTLTHLPSCPLPCGFSCTRLIPSPPVASASAMTSVCSRPLALVLAAVPSPSCSALAPFRPTLSASNPRPSTPSPGRTSSTLTRTSNQDSFTP